MLQDNVISREKKINRSNLNNLINLDISNLLEEYSNNNLALILIEENNKGIKKVYIKTKIQDKKITKNLDFKKELSTINLYKSVITETKKELIDLIKSKNLIDVRTPSFLNVKLNINKNSNLVNLNKRIKNIDAIEKIYVQEFNKDYMSLRIKYLGKLNKIISLLKIKDIDLRLINDEWTIRTL